MMLHAPSRPRRCRRGAVAIQIVLCLTLILGVAAIVLDGGFLFDQRRQAQSAADAAALAAANDLFLRYPVDKGQDPDGTAVKQAQAAAASYGYTNDGVNSIVTVNIPPQSGLFTDAKKYPGYVEVIVQANEDRRFSAIWGSDTLQVRARGVARGQWSPADAALLVLAAHTTDALQMKGNGGVQVIGGGSIQVNSDAAEAVSASGNGNLQIALPGKLFAKGGATGAGVPPTPSPPLPDPFRFLPAIDPTTLPVRTFPALGGIIYPGRYMGPCLLSGGKALILAGEGTPDPNNGFLPIAPGQAIYYFDGGPVSITGGGSLTSLGGVLIYYAPSSAANTFSLSGNGALTILPLTAGPYAGMSFFEARGATAAIIITGNTVALAWSGTFYAPDAPIQLSGDGSLTVAQLICNTLSLTGNGSLVVDSLAPKANVRYLQLVE